MQFNKIIGKHDPKVITQAEEKLSQVFLELGTRYDNDLVGSGMGGDPLIFSLMFPVEHVCTANIPTAATDGKRFYWNPQFVIEHSRVGLRLICLHEAFHALYLHPLRRGSRHPKLWNIAVDYIVNNTAMEDLKARRWNPTETFVKHLGNFITLKELVAGYKDPSNNGESFKKMVDAQNKGKKRRAKKIHPNEDRPLTDAEKKEIEEEQKAIKFYYADADLTEDLKSPEKIYDLLYNALPKCPTCGRLGVYPKQANQKGQGQQDKQKGNQQGNQKGNQQGQQGQNGQQKGKGKNQGQNGQGSDSDHNHGDSGNPCDCNGSCSHGGQDQNQSQGQGQGQDQSQSQNQGQGQGDVCPDCGGGIDVFGFGDCVDDHMDTEEQQDKLAKRIADAMEAAKKMAGHVPAALEDELGRLTAPKIRWQDFVKARLTKARQGNARNDWSRFKTRPMFSGLMVPKRRSYHAEFGCLLDCSGSMSKEDIALGVSQLQSLDERSEGVIVPADAEIYWDQSTKIRKASAEELQKVKVVGRGGTMFGEFFTDYENHIGKCDFLIVITDGFLLDTDMAAMLNPGIDVIWVITSNNPDFKPGFGRVFHLTDERS